LEAFQTRARDLTVTILVDGIFVVLRANTAPPVDGGKAQVAQ
jgi:hypothetical protein